MTPDFSPNVFVALAHASQAESAASVKLTQTVNRIAQMLAASLAPGQTAAGYRVVDGLLMRDGICVTDAPETFARDLVDGLLGRMAHELSERAAAIERLALALDGAPE